MSNKKFYWLKLKDDFFEEKYIKAMRKLPDGDALVIIYLKLQLKSLKSEGVIKYDKIMPSVEEELALLLDEDVNKVRLAVKAIVNMGIAEIWENETLYMSAMQELVGSETSGAERVRKHRQQKALQCNTSVTKCNTEIEIEKEIELDKEKDKDIIKSDKPTTHNNDSVKPYAEVINYLNEKANTGYKPNTKNTVKHINARLAEGYTVEDFKTVIDKKCAEWKGTEMEQYLRPETLFGTKFESYLNAKIIKKGGGANEKAVGNTNDDKFANWEPSGGTIY